MIDWSDAALEAALKSWNGTTFVKLSKKDKLKLSSQMRAVLDAAVAAQTGLIFDGFAGLLLYVARHEARADALEEAAKVVDESPLFFNSHTQIAAAIRALKEKK